MLSRTRGRRFVRPRSHGSRWLAIAALVASRRRKSLTTWILVAIVIGAEVGHDFPGVAANLRVLSQIFLRLIRTIVAPLLFATLVVGIAGHSNLKQVGRMGIKSLIYFEVVTTLALAIGWVAITMSRAGVGISHAGIGRAGGAAHQRSRARGRRSSSTSSRTTSRGRLPRPTSCRSWSSA